MRALALALACLVAAVYWWLPPAPIAMATSTAYATDAVRGAFHVHTRHSDGGGTVEEVAAAAARAGLRFVLLTDHGDGTRTPEPPTYRAGVLCVDSVEISTSDGHLVALGLAQAPYPLGGTGQNVVEDVARLGGVSVAAHPTSPRVGLRWREWTAPFDGLEWINGDAEWRDESPWALARTMLTFAVRPAASIGTLLDRPELSMRKWDALTARRRVVALAAADAHAWLALTNREDPPRGRALGLPLPGYESLFRTLSITVTGVQLSGRADEDARAVVDAVRRGHVFSTIDAIATGGMLTFTATSGANRATGGDLLTLDGEAQLHADVRGPPGARIVLFRDGVPEATVEGPTLTRAVDSRPAVYRVEAEVPGAPGRPPVPWIVSNPIYIGRTDAPAPSSRLAPASAVPLDREIERWAVEKSGDALGAIDLMPRVGGGQQAAFRFALSGSRATQPFAAMAVPVSAGLAGRDQISFQARASRPLRVSVQLRAANDDSAPARWTRSVYLDTEPREVSLSFGEFRVVSGGEETARPLPLERVAAILFVLDTVNTSPGSNGQLTITGLRAESFAPGRGRAQVRTVSTK